jgi:hypothetical protein
MEERIASYVAECFWPDVGTEDLAALDTRVEAAIAELGDARHPIRYLGSILVREDEVVLCQFEGSADLVREAAERAAIPFDRILETARSPWSSESREAKR